MSKNTFYLTTTLPYVNAEPHIGFALEIIAGDVISRYHRLLGEDVTFNTGTDEHGQKIYQKAQEEAKDPQDYVDEYAAKFNHLKELLNLSYDRFIRTTDDHHKKAAQEFWRRCQANGDIYKKLYSVKYCIGCELEKTDSELVDGRCPLHPNKELEIREEENYFFRFSKYQQSLLDLYQKNPTFVKPDAKMKEIKSFVEQGLQDFSISRLKEKMPWGVAVPDDNEHVMYVWFDALVNYISTIGWPEDMATFEKYWPVVQIAGKDNLRQQSAMWQAMLMSAGVENSQQILINGFISVAGQKMSKSLGNVISPQEMVERYGADGSRYLLMSLGPIGDDMDVTWERLDTSYTAALSNGLGNLCSRVAKLCEKADVTLEADQRSLTNFAPEYSALLAAFELSDALSWAINQVSETDQYLSDTTPWKKTGAEQADILKTAVKKILLIAYHLQPFMPDTARKILGHFTAEKITALEPLFPRLPN
ncbi:MAG TPA: methionine--tRNA ligase [Patescibacteria group bacterium]